jgi:hypothetical protein
MSKSTKKRHQEIMNIARQVLKEAGGIEAHLALPAHQQGPKFLEMARHVAELTQCVNQTSRNNMAKVMRQARGELMKDNWGGKRTPGQGKTLGPAPLPAQEKRVAVSTRLAPGSKELAQAIAEVLELPGWGHAMELGLMALVKDKEIRGKLADMGIIVKGNNGRGL